MIGSFHEPASPTSAHPGPYGRRSRPGRPVTALAELPEAERLIAETARAAALLLARGPREALAGAAESVSA